MVIRLLDLLRGTLDVFLQEEVTIAVLVLGPGDSVLLRLEALMPELVPGSGDGVLLCLEALMPELVTGTVESVPLHLEESVRKERLWCETRHNTFQCNYSKMVILVKVIIKDNKFNTLTMFSCFTISSQICFVGVVLSHSRCLCCSTTKHNFLTVASAQLGQSGIKNSSMMHQISYNF